MRNGQQTLDRVLECLRRKGNELGLIYMVLHGSWALGLGGPHSDFDLAVKTGRSRDSLLNRGMLNGELEECLPPSARLDLVFLEDWNPVAFYEILWKGILVYYCEKECLREYYMDKARAIDEVADLEPLLRRLMEETELPAPGLINRLVRARRSLARLRKLAALGWERSSSHEDAQALAERHLHIVLETIPDLASFIASRKSLAKGVTYRDILVSVVWATLSWRTVSGGWPHRYRA